MWKMIARARDETIWLDGRLGISWRRVLSLDCARQGIRLPVRGSAARDYEQGLYICNRPSVSLVPVPPVFERAVNPKYYTFPLVDRDGRWCSLLYPPRAVSMPTLSGIK